MSRLLTVLDQITEVIGAEAALRLVQELGGTTVKISADPEGKLVQVIGLKNAEALVKAWARGYSLTVPMANLRGQGARRALVARMLAQGETVSAAALGGDVHERTVKRVKARMRDQGELPLFSQKK